MTGTDRPFLDLSTTVAALDADVERFRAAYLAAAGEAARAVIERHEPESPWAARAHAGTLPAKELRP